MARQSPSPSIARVHCRLVFILRPEKDKMLNLDDGMDALPYFPTYRNGYLGLKGLERLIQQTIVRAFDIKSTELEENRGE